MEARSTTSRNSARGVGGASEVRLLFVFDAAREAISWSPETGGPLEWVVRGSDPTPGEHYAVYQRQNREKGQR
jgi:hypothetical protein